MTDACRPGEIAARPCRHRLSRVCSGVNRRAGRSRPSSSPLWLDENSAARCRASAAARIPAQAGRTAPCMPDWGSGDIVSPPALADIAGEWRKSFGFGILGGCCGPGSNLSGNWPGCGKQAARPWQEAARLRDAPGHDCAETLRDRRAGRVLRLTENRTKESVDG